MKTILKSALFLLTLTASNAFANHYGMAGCGLGSLVFKDQPGMVQVFAATLNNFVSPQTSAISSGTSGCYEKSSSEAANQYMDTNKVALQKDISQGEGETLTGLLGLLGCNGQEEIGQALQKSYEVIYSNGNNSDSAKKEIKTIIRSQSSQTDNCSALI